MTRTILDLALWIGACALSAALAMWIWRLWAAFALAVEGAL